MKPLFESIKEDKSEADKMFEELEYRKLIIKEKFGIWFIKRGYTGINRIFFNKVDKKIHLELDYDIDMQELQAINEKCREMGWLDE